MELFHCIVQLIDDWPASAISRDDPEPHVVNPATGLPTTGGVGTSDVTGNPFGIDLSRCHDHDWDRGGRWATASFYDGTFRWHDDRSSSGMRGGHDPWRD